MKLLRIFHGQLKQQLNKNNKGSSLVTILLVASIVAALITVVLAVVILNVYMKKADIEGEKAFYDAESALEEIRIGLGHAESDATRDAYLKTIANYTELEDDEKTDFFNNEFSTHFTEQLKDHIAGGVIYYDPQSLVGFLRGTAYNVDEGYGAEIIPVMDNEGKSLNVINETEEGLVLKNVDVKYTDRNNYVSEIKTDIVLQFPPIDFQDAASIGNVLTYGIVANETFIPSGAGVEVTGNAYLGSEGVDITDAGLGRGLTFNAADKQESNVISGKDIKLDNSILNINKDVSLWTDSVDLDNSSQFNMTSGAAYIKNDILLANNTSSTLSGKLIMFGNPHVAKSDYVNSPEVRNDAEKNMPDYSSSILILGANAGLDMKNLDTMVIGGSAYIDTQHDKDNNRIARNKDNVVMGQSMALKSDQRAYLVPPNVVAGKANPMTGSKFDSIMKDIANEKYNGDKSKVLLHDYADFAAMDTSLAGLSIYVFYREFFKDTAVYDLIKDINLADYDQYESNDSRNGTTTYEEALSTYKTDHDVYKNALKSAADNNTDVPGDYNRYLPNYIIYEYITNRPTVAVNAYNDAGSIIYLFIQFTSIGENYGGQQNATYVPAEAFYNAWYRTYHYMSYVNKDRLRLNLTQYYVQEKGIKLPNNVNDKTKMYFTGNILTTEDANYIVPDSITRADFTMDLNRSYSKQSAYYQDAYYTLNKNLTTRYLNLPDAAKSKSLFENLVQTSTKAVDENGDPYTMSKDGTYYISTTGEGAVVIVGDFTYDPEGNQFSNIKTTKDINGNVWGDNADINAIIATGDVTVKSNYTGLIIAGGKINVDGSVKITADSDKASKALNARKYKNNSEDDEKKVDNELAGNFIINFAKYIAGNAMDPEEEDEDDLISMKNYVSYRNWTRQ